MEISELVWRLFILLLPGVIAILLVRYSSTSKEYSNFYFIIYSAIMGIGILILLELVISLYNIMIALFSSDITIQFGLNLTIWDGLIDKSKSFNKFELFVSYISSIPIGIVVGGLIQKKRLIRLLQKFKITNRFGDTDVWNYILNSPDTDWIIVRDNKNNLAYFGMLKAYSDTGEIREIILTDVDVYFSDNWEELYKSEVVYLELEHNNFSIELPKKD